MSASRSPRTPEDPCRCRRNSSTLLGLVSWRGEPVLGVTCWAIARMNKHRGEDGARPGTVFVERLPACGGRGVLAWYLLRHCGRLAVATCSGVSRKLCFACSALLCLHAASARALPLFSSSEALQFPAAASFASGTGRVAMRWAACRDPGAMLWLAGEPHTCCGYGLCWRAGFAATLCLVDLRKGQAAGALWSGSPAMALRPRFARQTGTPNEPRGPRPIEVALATGHPFGFRGR